MALLGRASVSKQNVNKFTGGESKSHGSTRVRRTLLAGILGTIALAGLGTAIFYLTSQPATLRFAVGTRSGDARFVQLLAHEFSRARSSLQIAPILLEDSAAAARAVDDREADIAIVRRDLAFPQSGQAIAVLRESFAAIIVPAPGSRAAGAKPQATRKQAKKKREPVSKIEDLEGRRIGVAGFTNIELLHEILAEYQVAKDKVTIVPLDPRDIAGSLRGKSVDALFVVGPVEGPVLADAIASARNGKIQPVLLSVGASEAIAAHKPIYESSEIKAGVLGGHPPLPEEAVETVSVKDYVIAHNSLPESAAAEFTRLLFDARQRLNAIHPSFAKLEKPDTDRDAAVAAHPGAVAFLDNDQKTFLEKYSDFIYLGLMLVSALGSALAWLLSRARNEERMRRLTALDRLREIVKAARAASTLDELLEFRKETDDLLTGIVEQAEKHELAESSLMIFALALDQAHLAIAERRAELTGLAQIDGLRSKPARLNVVRGAAGGLLTTT